MDRRLFLKSSLAAAALARLGVTKEPPVQTTDIVAGNNLFALDLFGKVRKEEGNLFCSPFSVSTALAMASVGARGKTAEEMIDLLHFPGAPEAGHSVLGKLIQQFSADDPRRGYLLAVANALWTDKSFGFKKEFLDFVNKHYAAKLTDLDFVHQSEKSRQTINQWVEKQTHERIKDLMPSGSIDSETRLVITNAIYFKGTWADQFNKNATKDEMFQVTDTEKIKTPMMHRSGSYGYFENGAVQLLSIPFKGRELSMLFALPKNKGGLADLEAKLTADNVRTWIAAVRPAEITVALPKFELTKKFDLIPTLRDMGMKAAFTGGADFSGISESGKLFISDVVHKAFVLVNEEGAEAAASTGIGFKLTAAPVRKEFRADHPFLFFIRDNKSGSILFIGRLANPSSK